MANKPENLKPFTKNDPRINRAGRPKSFDAWRKLHLEVLSEIALDKDGRPIIIDVVTIDKDGNQVVTQHYATQAEMMIRSDIRIPTQRQSVKDAAFGKVPQAVELSGDINATITTVTPEELAKARQKALEFEDGQSTET